MSQVKWIIELAVMGVTEVSCGSYWCGGCLFNIDKDKAIRFNTKDEADDAIRSIYCHGKVSARTVECVFD